MESLATVCIQMRRFDEALGHYNSSLSIRRDLGDKLGEAAILNGLGLSHLRRRKLSESRAMFSQCQQIVTDLDNTHWQAVAAGNVATVYYEMGELDPALEASRSALSISEGLGDQLGQGNSLHELSRIERELGHFDNAVDYINQALSIAREHDNSVWEGFWLIEFGNVQREIGQVTNALISYERSVELHLHIDDRSREAQALDAPDWHITHLGITKKLSIIIRARSTSIAN